MKKILSITLAIVLLLGLCACQKQPEKAAFRAGYASVDITPTQPVPLSGYGNSLTRVSEGVFAPLYASCVALADEAGSMVLLISVDVASSSGSLTTKARETISKETGIPMEQIMVSATHTHSAPDYGADHAGSQAATLLLTDGIVEAAKDAIADLSPAKIQIGTADAEGLNFVRHYLMNDGSYSGDNHGSTESGYKDHATEADSEMQIIRYVREEEGKKDILAVNWQAHPKLSSTSTTVHGSESKKLISSDFIGPLREYVQSETKCHFIYYQGAAGNLNPISNIKSENKTSGHANEVGRLLADVVIGGLDDLKDVSSGTISAKKYTYSAPVDHSDDHLLSVAQSISHYWAESNDYAGCVKQGAEYGIYSPYHANAIVTRAGIQNDLSIDIYAVAAGGISFVAFPYEMFDTNGMYIKENTPFDMTFIMGYANSHLGYIASEKAFEYGSYEVDIRRYEKGTAEKLAEQFVTMLKELKG